MHCRKRSVAEFIQKSIVFLLRVQCRRKESSRSLYHLLMSFLFNVVALTGTRTNCTTVFTTISREGAAPRRLISTPITLFSTLHGSSESLTAPSVSAHFIIIKCIYLTLTLLTLYLLSALGSQFWAPSLFVLFYFILFLFYFILFFILFFLNFFVLRVRLS